MKKIMMLALGVSVLLVIGCSGSSSTEPESGSSAPTNLQLTYIFDEITCSVDLIWDAPEEPDNESFEYRVYKNDQILTSLTSLQNYYTDNDCFVGGEYTYYITAYCSTGESDSTNVESIYFDMTGILIDNGGNWYFNDENQQYGCSLHFSDDGSFTYSCGWPGGGFTNYGSFTVDHTFLSCSYSDSTGTNHTKNGDVSFTTYNMMTFDNTEWERY